MPITPSQLNSTEHTITAIQIYTPCNRIIVIIFNTIIDGIPIHPIPFRYVFYLFYRPLYWCPAILSFSAITRPGELLHVLYSLDEYLLKFMKFHYPNQGWYWNLSSGEDHNTEANRFSRPEGNLQALTTWHSLCDHNFKRKYEANELYEFRNVFSWTVDTVHSVESIAWQFRCYFLVYVILYSKNIFNIKRKIFIYNTDKMYTVYSLKNH